MLCRRAQKAECTPCWLPLLSYGDETNYTTLSVLSYTVPFTVLLCCRGSFSVRRTFIYEDSDGWRGDARDYRSLAYISSSPNPMALPQCPYAVSLMAPVSLMIQSSS